MLGELQALFDYSDNGDATILFGCFNGWSNTSTIPFWAKQFSPKIDGWLIQKLIDPNP